jgi:hypothetical protein
VITRPDGCRPGPMCRCATLASDSGEPCAKCAACPMAAPQGRPRPSPRSSRRYQPN